MRTPRTTAPLLPVTEPGSVRFGRTQVARPGRPRPTSRLRRAIRRKWLRLRVGLARGGAEYFLTSALSYLPYRLVSYRHHVLLRCDGEPAGRVPQVVTTRVVTLDDVEDLAGHLNLDATTLERRLGRGDTCVVALEDGRPVAVAWAGTGTRYLLGLGRVFDVAPDAFYVFDTFTDPAARRRGFATSVYQALFAHFADEGRTTVCAAVEVLNEPSLRAHEGWGFVSVGRARKLLLPGLRLALCPAWPVRGRALHLEPRRRRLPYRPA